MPTIHPARLLKLASHGDVCDNCSMEHIVKLTDEERNALRCGEAVRIRDNGSEYVLLRADVFDRVRQLLYNDGEWTDGDLRQMLARSAAANGWNEPEMEAYDRYDAEMQKRCP